MDNNILDTKLNIYEAYDNGYITESEKSELLDILESSKNEDNSEKVKKALKTITKVGVAITAIIVIFKALEVASSIKKNADAQRSKVDHDLIGEKNNREVVDDIIRELREYKTQLDGYKKDIDDAYKKYKSDENETTGNALDKCLDKAQECVSAAGKYCTKHKAIVSKFGTAEQIKRYDDIIDNIGFYFNNQNFNKLTDKNYVN